LIKQPERKEESGMTSQLQPLDVSVNKPFKDFVRAEYEKWILSDNLPLTKSGKIKKTPMSKIAEWISRAWSQVSPAIVAKSFQKCWVTNAMDGSQDDILWEDVECDDCDNLSSSAEDDSDINDSSDDDDD